MLVLLTLPVVALTAVAHRCLRSYAPSNILITRVRAAPPRLRTAGAVLLTALLLGVGVRGLNVAISGGAPAWLNLAALTLAWDSIKLSLFAAEIGARCAA